MAHASAARSAAGRRAKRTNGSAHAATSGTRSILAGFALPAFTSGLRRNAYLAADGRRTRIGMPPRENDDLSNECREAVLESHAGSTAMPFIDTSALEVIERFVFFRLSPNVRDALVVRGGANARNTTEVRD
jgi:hypothetical protein